MFVFEQLTTKVIKDKYQVIKLAENLSDSSIDK